jgi:hypothetical protein
MMTFPAANPAVIGAPFEWSVFVLPPAVMEMGLALGILILAVCVATLFVRLGSRVVAWPMRTRPVAMPNMGKSGAHHSGAHQ